MLFAGPRMIKRTLVLLALMFAAVSGASAQGTSVTLICPIDGKRFQYQSPPTTPLGGRYLDMKPLGPANVPWPFPQCPDNSFVIFKKEFTESEIGKLREFVASDRYRSMIGAHTNYYLAAVLRREAGEPPYDVAWSLAQATWEVSANPVRYKQYAEEALAAFDALPKGRFLDRQQNVVREMLSGELERRLARFDSAEKRFRRIRDEAEFVTPQLQHVIELQLKLIDKKDTGSHQMPR